MYGQNCYLIVIWYSGLHCVIILTVKYTSSDVKSTYDSSPCRKYIYYNMLIDVLFFYPILHYIWYTIIFIAEFYVACFVLDFFPFIK